MHAVIVGAVVLTLVVVLCVLNNKIVNSSGKNNKKVSTKEAIDKLSTDLLFSLEEMRSKELSVGEIENHIFKIETLIQILETMSSRSQLQNSHNIDLDVVDGIMLETKKMLNSHSSSSGSGSGSGFYKR